MPNACSPCGLFSLHSQMQICIHALTLVCCGYGCVASTAIYMCCVEKLIHAMKMGIFGIEIEIVSMYTLYKHQKRLRDDDCETKKHMAYCRRSIEAHSIIYRGYMQLGLVFIT